MHRLDAHLQPRHRGIDIDGVLAQCVRQMALDLAARERREEVRQLLRAQGRHELLPCLSGLLRAAPFPCEAEHVPVWTASLEQGRQLLHRRRIAHRMACDREQTRGSVAPVAVPILTRVVKVDQVLRTPGRREKLRPQHLLGHAHANHSCEEGAVARAIHVHVGNYLGHLRYAATDSIR